MNLSQTAFKTIIEAQLINQCSMKHTEPIKWIRDLYHDRSEEEILEAEYNFRDLVLFLYYSDITLSDEVITEHKKSKDLDKEYL